MSKSMTILGLIRCCDFCQISLLGGTISLPVSQVPDEINQSNYSEYHVIEQQTPTENPAIFQASYTIIKH